MIPAGLERALRCAAERREARGSVGDATLRLEPLTAQEADALDGLRWPGRQRRFLSGQGATIKLVRFEAALQAAGLSPAQLYQHALGRSLRDRPAEGRARRAQRDSFRQTIASDPRLIERPALRDWLDRSIASGRVRPRDGALVADALRAIERLPSAHLVGRAVLAADVYDGRSHALDPDTALGRLVDSMLAAWQELGEAVRGREIWGAAGVEVDSTSTTVLALGLEPRGDSPVEIALRAQLGRHVVLTYGQVQEAEARWPAGEVFVCENPSVLRAAERALGGRSAPLVCGSGWPSDAVRLLLAQLRAAGATLRYHGDFDARGVAIFRLLERHDGVVPWRYDTDAYAQALQACAGRDLPKVAAKVSGVPGDLETALARDGREVVEELVIDQLLDDLVAAQA